MISSIASRGSERAAAIVSTPTGPPPKCTAIASVAPVHLVEADSIDLQQAQRAVGDRSADDRGALDDGEIAYAAQQASCNAGRAARTPRDLVGTVVGKREADD